MITLDELIADLQRLRAQTAEDVSVRLVIRREDDGCHYTVIEPQLVDYINDSKIVVVFAGDWMGTMDWPGLVQEEK